MNSTSGYWTELRVGDEEYRIVSLDRAAARAAAVGARTDLARLPRSLRVLLENNLRHAADDAPLLQAFGRWLEHGSNPVEVGYWPTRVMMPDSSGIPLICDLAAMRERMAADGLDPARVNPVRPVDLIMDHSVTATEAGHPGAMRANVEEEFRLNVERYALARWAQGAFDNLRVVPPGQGICHQINLEHLAQVVWSEADAEGRLLAFPDSLVAGDSHTPMVNALAVMGWGVGGIEAMAALLGEPISMTLPDVVGVRLVGRPRPGVTATDIVLTLTARLREVGVTQKFVEFCGPALAAMSLPMRATIANMCPEYGASLAFFPVDEETLAYLRLTDRAARAPLVEAYARAQGLWADGSEPRFSRVVAFDLGSVEASVSGPNLPQATRPLGEVAGVARASLEAAGARSPQAAGPGSGARSRPQHGDIAIAAITSCTNTSNPDVVLAAALLARNAAARGLRCQPWVKTSFSPGSRVVSDYLSEAGLMEALETLGFHVVGFGCMTCIGSSGPLLPAMQRAVTEDGVIAAAVHSGNRNFSGRSHPQVHDAYLASPPLVVAYALTGSMLTDLTREPLGNDAQGQPVYLADVWPSPDEVTALAARHLRPQLFAERYAAVESGDEHWQAIQVAGGQCYAWREDSDLIQRPPFLDSARPASQRPELRDGAILAVFGDYLTTDHISPGGQIPGDSEAASLLRASGVQDAEFGTYIQRRCNTGVMLRGTFNNPRIQNRLTPQRAGGWTVHQPSGELLSIRAAAGRYRDEGRPLVVFAGQGYGAGSSRDWAAKGPHLLGVDAIIAESFERIHRSNLIGMGIAPLELDGRTLDSLGLRGDESIDIPELWGPLAIGRHLTLHIRRADGSSEAVAVCLRLDTEREVQWMAAGGVMPYVLEGLHGNG